MFATVSESAKQRAKKLLVGAWAAAAGALVLMILAGLFLNDRTTALVRDGGFWAVLAMTALLSFVAEYVDSSLGMGYGTTLTPTLLLLGFDPLQVVPAILVQELISGSIAAAGHHWWGNVDLRPGKPAFAIAVMLGGCGLVGGLIAGRVAVALPKETIKLLTGGIVTAMGVLVALAATGKLRFAFSWPRAAVLGLVAAFNKGFMGGGYGPIVTSGQIVSGASAKSAVAITSASELLTCAGGLIGYMLGSQGVDWKLAGGLVLGGTVAAALASPTVRALPVKRLTTAVSVGCFVLGAITIVNAIK